MFTRCYRSEISAGGFRPNRSLNLIFAPSPG
jgi:hypothetical protein